MTDLPTPRGTLTPERPLSDLTWLRVGGPAQWLFQPADRDDLAVFLRDLPMSVPVFPMGVGSNLIVRDGGIGGQKIQVPECETAYNTEKGVECYESTKGQGALVYNPFSTGITYQLIPKASTDKIPLYTPGYGRTSSKNGKVFEWVFNAPANYWDGASIIVKHLLDVHGGSLEGKKIALLYHNSAYGKEPIRTLQELAKKHGFTLTELPVEPPGQEQKSQWLQIRREKPDYVILYGWGVMNQAAVQEAATRGTSYGAPTEGEVLLDGENLLDMPVDERARAGLFLAMQYPTEVPGVKVSQFMRSAVTSIRGEAPKLREWNKELTQARENLKIDKSFISRSVNEGFSGGEKKRHEVMQLDILKPKFAVMDETDSGLDVDALRIVSEGINSYQKETNGGILMITHYKRILNYVKPDFVHVFADGHVIKTGGAELADQLESDGYDQFLK